MWNGTGKEKEIGTAIVAGEVTLKRHTLWNHMTMKKTKLTFVFSLFAAVGLIAQHNQKMDANVPVFKDAKVGIAYEYYLHLKDALVGSRPEGTKSTAGELQKALALVADGKKAIDEAAKVAASANLVDQRKAFSILSNEMATLVKGGKLSMGILYLEYCPMANNYAGAYWLSNEKEIKNPYFGYKMLKSGDNMLKCGRVKGMIH